MSTEVTTLDPEHPSDPGEAPAPTVRRPAGSGRRRRFRRLGILAGLLGLAALAMTGLSSFLVTLTDWEWYDSVGHGSVFWTKILSVLAVWLAFTAATLAVILPGARSAWRTVGAPGRFRRGTALACLLLAGLMSLPMASRWMVFRLAVDQSPFGVKDPQFGLDVGFFVFTMPALELLVGWALNVVLLVMALYFTIVLASSRLDPTGQLAVDWWRVKRVYWRLGAVLLAVIAVKFLVSVWQLSYSTGQTSWAGASFTDLHAALPGYIALIIGCLLVAAVLLATAKSRRFRPALVALGALAVAAFLAGQAVPSAVQRFWATPNEATVEKPYLARNIAMTRIGFELNDVANVAYPGLEELSGSRAVAAAAELQGAPVWSATTVNQAFNQLQTIRPYYQLSTIGTDRYRFDGGLHQVLIAARQISASGLPASANTWVNRRLVYTHGYGVAISSASATTAQGFPQFLVGDIPATVSPTVTGEHASLTVTQPRVYFGPDMTDWAVVNTGVDEFDYPQGTANVTNRYAGTDGVPVGNLLNRLAWSMRLRSQDLLVSDYVHADSRILTYRSVVGRARKIAPWLSYDTPYPAIVGGRITWIIDAYTSSNHFPYSQPLPNGINYLRDSVKVTVDAETGATTFYANGTDPIRDAWARIFPGVITAQSQLPADLAAHLRTPQRLFAAQASVFAKYHMTDAGVFYGGEDQWRIPTDASGNAVGPQYVILTPPQAQDQGLQLLQPYALPSRDNLVGWLSGASEPGEYGARTVYRLPKSRVTLGAAQASARINQDPKISQQLTLWNQPGSTVLFGNMLVLPVQGGIAYLQAVFQQAQGSAITELVGVIAVNGDRVELGTDLPDALAKAYG